MEEPLPLRAHKVCYFSQRFITIFMAAIGVTLSFLLRMMFDTVMQKISSHKEHAPMSNVSICGRTINTTSSLLSQNIVFDWNSKAVNVITHSYWTGYIPALVVGGVISDKFGGKLVLTVSMFTSCILLLVVPRIATDSKGNYIVFGIMRALFGLFTGPTLPAANTLISFWAPLSDRGKLCAMVYCTSQLAVVLNLALTNAIIVYWNSWQTVFYVYAIVGLIWAVLWYFFCFSDPWDNPYMDEEEFNFLDNNLKPHVITGNKPIPWISLFTCVHFYVFLFAHCSHIFLWHTIRDDVPLYTHSVLQFDIDDTPLARHLPYILTAILVNCLGHITDYLVIHELVSLTNVRIILSIFGLMGPAVFVIVAVYSGCNKTTITLQFGIGLTIMSCYYIGTRANSLDLAPNFSGVVLGIADATSSLSLFLFTTYVESFTLKGGVTEWKYVFWTYLVIAAGITVIFSIFASADEEDWNNEDDEDHESV